MPALIIDCQLLQTPAWDRGMARYTIGLLSAVFNRGLVADHDIEVLYNRNLPTNPARLDILRSHLPGAREVTLDLPVSEDGRSLRVQQEAARRTLNRYVEASHPRDETVFLVPSNFTLDYCAVFPSAARKLLILYDLIPLVMWQEFSRYYHPDLYFGRFSTVLEADTVLAISRASADDAISYLGVARSRVVVIDGGPVDQDRLDPDPGFSTTRPYVLMPSADLPHKNNERAIEGFDLFNRRRGERAQLVITSTFRDETQSDLRRLTQQAVFIGHVPDAQLRALYERAEVVLSASLKEGLGLPVLEAVACGRRVACSDIPVFREMTDDGFYFFNPTSATSIADALELAFDARDWERKRESYELVKSKYTWERSAELFAGALRTPVRRVPVAARSRRWAVICPHPRTGAAAGRAFEFLAPALQDVAEVVFYLDDGGSSATVAPAHLEWIAPCHDVRDFGARQYRRFDEIVYVVDGSPFSVDVAKLACALPGRLMLFRADFSPQRAISERSQVLSRNLAQLSRCLSEHDQGRGLVTLLVNAARTVFVADEASAHYVSRLLMRDVPVHRIEFPPADPDSRVSYDGSCLVNELTAAVENSRSDNDALAAYLRTRRWPRTRTLMALFERPARSRPT